jgi:hypothetical protein
MKRWTIRIFVLLLLGAIVNVAVAWIGFFNADINSAPNQSRATGSPDEIALWNRHSSPRWPSQATTSGHERRLFTDMVRLGHLAFNEDGSERFVVTRVRCGAPMRSFTWEEWNGSPWDKRLPRSDGDDGVRIAGIHVPRIVLPIGFVVNTIVFALILWLPFSAPLGLRRRRRIRRGLCPKCGYDLRGSGPHTAACPECGTAVSLALSGTP